MKENRMKAVLESIVQRDVPADANLWSRIAERVERKNFMQIVRTRPALALFLVLLALALLSSVAYAIGRVTGYIPGVGIIDQSIPLRILKESVVEKRDGLTVTVSQVVADSEHTVLIYTLDGLPATTPATLGKEVCHEVPLLQLPNGHVLNFLGGGGGVSEADETGEYFSFETTYYFPPLPGGVDQVTLIFPCILPKGTGPENWQISLALSPAPKDYATPGVEIGATYIASNPRFITTPSPTSDISSTPEALPSSFPNTSTPVPNGSGLYLDKVIELPDSYILVGNFTDAGDLPGPFVYDTDPHENLPQIKDADGNPVAFKVRDDIQPTVSWGGARYWAFEIAKPVRGPLTITLDHVDVDIDYTARFDIDTGHDPKPGQVWKLNRSIHLDKYDYVIDSMEMVEGGYSFQYHSGTDAPEGVSLNIDFVDHLSDGGTGSQDRGETVVEYSNTITYSSPPPTGPLTVEFLLVELVPLKGPWTLTWTPPSK